NHSRKAAGSPKIRSNVGWSVSRSRRVSFTSKTMIGCLDMSDLSFSGQLDVEACRPDCAGTHPDVCPTQTEWSLRLDRTSSDQLNLPYRPITRRSRHRTSRW